MNRPTLEVCEIFKSIQGESLHAGLPCAFIRLSGCNLRCGYCDTRYSYANGKTMAIERVLKKVEGFKTRVVEITGGEPLLQSGTIPLMRKLLSLRHTVLLETNGSISLKNVPEGVVKIMDIKCPSSGMSGKVCWENLALLGPHDPVKFVIGDRKDYRWAKRQVISRKLSEKQPVLFSPVWKKQKAAVLAEWILKDRLSVRLQVPLHKVLWPSENRGK